MNGRIDSGLGQIVIDTDVIATYAGSVAVECFGIVGMAAVSMKDGLVKLLLYGKPETWYQCQDHRGQQDPPEFPCDCSVWRKYQYDRR